MGSLSAGIGGVGSFSAGIGGVGSFSEASDKSCWGGTRELVGVAFLVVAAVKCSRVRTRELIGGESEGVVFSGLLAERMTVSVVVDVVRPVDCLLDRVVPARDLRGGIRVLLDGLLPATEVSL